MGILVIGAAFLDIKGFPDGPYSPTGRNAGRIEYIHGGAARNVAEDIANAELRPIYLGIADDSPMGQAVLQKLRNHKVNTDYSLVLPDGMGTWLAVFDSKGDLAGSVSRRPNMQPLEARLDEKGDEIFSAADAVVLEVDLDKGIVRRALDLAKKYRIPVYGLVSNMQIAVERRDFLQHFTCFICNQQEAGILFLEDYSQLTPDRMQRILARKVQQAHIPSMVVTMGSQGAVYADSTGLQGYCPALQVQVRDTTGAGDAFCAGVAIGLTYGKSMAEATRIGSMLAASVITSSENVCPRFLPEELGIARPEFLQEVSL